MTSTLPSPRFLTVPRTPRSEAFRVTNQRNPTPCTRPCTTHLLVSMAPPPTLRKRIAATRYAVLRLLLNGAYIRPIRSSGSRADQRHPEERYAGAFQVRHHAAGAGDSRCRGSASRVRRTGTGTGNGTRRGN